MYKFGRNSKKQIATIDHGIQLVLNRAIRYMDFYVPSYGGARTSSDQYELFMKGRRFENGKHIIVDKKKVVTYCDGTKKLSSHQSGMAVDVVPYFPKADKINVWEEKNHIYFYMLAGRILQIGDDYYEQGILPYPLMWGGDWNGNNRSNDERFLDLPHIQYNTKVRR